jgi:hypothetical protein
MLQFYNENYNSIHMKKVEITTGQESVPLQYYTESKGKWSENSRSLAYGTHAPIGKN